MNNEKSENKIKEQKMGEPMVKKATEYAVLVWEVKPEDYPMLGCPDKEYGFDTLPEAMAFYEDIFRDDITGPVFAMELHHYYEVDTKEWESASNVLMEWETEDTV
tara:strand:- start:61 stop:375 length:315 start_codon:yes stop_codon:yes gene_type:complete